MSGERFHQRLIATIQRNLIGTAHLAVADRMYSSSTVNLIFLALLSSPAIAQTSSTKRGLVYVDSTHSTTDDEQFTASGSDVTWYYNYAFTATSSLNSLEYVPMLWGSDSDGFLDGVKSQLSSGVNITHVLSFNEPDGTTETGGSDMDPDTAASEWMKNIAPLRSNYGLKVGLPAVTGSQQGFTWLASFNTSCKKLSSSGCEADFIPTHWYGNFEGFASQIGQVRADYPQLPIWVTEFAYPDVNEANTKSFFNESLSYLDRLDYVERYSYFGSFRAKNSNVGKNVAMLKNNGKLNELGKIYVGTSASSSAGSVVHVSGYAITGIVAIVGLLQVLL